MSQSYNNIRKSVAPKSLFDDATPLVSAAISWNQGDLLWYDAATSLIKTITEATAQSVTFLGVARVKVVLGLLVSPYQGTAVDASEKAHGIPGPIANVTAELTMATGVTFNPGNLIYAVDSDPQLVTTVADGRAIGIYQGKAVASAAAGQKGEFYIKANYGDEIGAS